MDRNRWLLEGLEKTSSVILEIGPSFYPVAPKRDGWNTLVVDHCSRADLVSKYKTVEGLDLSLIEEVDVVWTGGMLSESLQPAQPRKFDAVILSHVIEHIVDPVGFYKDVAGLLGSDGALRLAVPDKRLCFDCLRPPSTTGQLLEAHLTGRNHHTPAAVFDALAADARPPGQPPSWSQTDRFRPEFHRDIREAKAHLERAHQPNSQYIDVHGWVYTPASFELAIWELRYLDAIQLGITEVLPRDALEFLVKMRLLPVKPNDSSFVWQRLQLQTRMLSDQREGLDWLLGSAPIERNSGHGHLLYRLEQVKRLLAS